MVLAHLLVAYEFKLEDSCARPFFSFGKARLPNPFMVLLVRKRVSIDRDEHNSNAQSQGDIASVISDATDREGCRLEKS